MDLRFWKTKKSENKEVVKKYVESKISFIDLIQGYDGSKANMTVGFGVTKDLRSIDLRMLQFRSLQLSRENGFASAILGLLETKIINVGLRMRANPLEAILKKVVNTEFLQDWSNTVEALWTVWSKDKRLVTVKKEMTLSELERTIYRTAKLSGDCLVIKMINKQGLPVVDIIDGINVVTPIAAEISDKDVVHGVEHNAKGQEIAYWYNDKNGETKRIEAYTTRGDRRAWLVRATEKRIDERRGLPLLSVVMQNINELGRYLDSEQRAALVNSYIAVVHNRDKEKTGSGDPFNKMGKTVDSTDPDSDAQFKQMQPGYFATKLAAGETISSFDTSRPNVNFNKFFEIISKIMSYSLGIPPECLFLEFNSNYSASRQAKLEFEDLAKKEIAIFSGKFNQPLYESWLDGMVLTGRIKAPGYISAMRDLNQFDILGAWRSSKYRGIPKSNVDGLKQIKELVIAEEHGYLTADQITDEYYNGDWEQNMRQISIEAEKKKEILEIYGTADAALTEIEQFRTELANLQDMLEDIKDLQENK